MLQFSKKMEFYRLKLLGFCISFLLILNVCHGKNVTIKLIGLMHCADCMKPELSQAQTSGMHVAINCESRIKQKKTQGRNTSVDKDGNFKLTLYTEMQGNGNSLNDRCYVKLQSTTSTARCPIHKTQTASIKFFSFKENEASSSQTTYEGQRLITISPITCQSAFFCPFIKPLPKPETPYLPFPPPPFPAPEYLNPQPAPPYLQPISSSLPPENLNPKPAPPYLRPISSSLPPPLPPPENLSPRPAPPYLRPISSTLPPPLPPQEKLSPRPSPPYLRPISSSLPPPLPPPIQGFGTPTPSPLSFTFNTPPFAPPPRIPAFRNPFRTTFPKSPSPVSKHPFLNSPPPLHTNPKIPNAPPSPNLVPQIPILQNPYSSPAPAPEISTQPPSSPKLKAPPPVGMFFRPKYRNPNPIPRAPPIPRIPPIPGAP